MKNGFTLLEVVISLFLMAMAMLVIQASIHKTAQNARSQSYLFSAIFLVDNMREYLTARRGDATGYLQSWREDIDRLLPSAHGGVRRQSHADIITIAWGGWSGDCQQNTTGMSGCVVVNFKN